MQIVIYKDNTLPIPIESICALLNSACKEIKFTAGVEKFRIETPSISMESAYDNLPSRLTQEAARHDYAILCTNVPYENNYFFEYTGKIILISFDGWNLFTDLPTTNGLVYFIASVLCDELGVGETHSGNIGCINDFWGDKRGVNVGMRAGFICEDCRSKYTGDPKLLKDIQSLLDLVSQASRSDNDVVNIRPAPTDATKDDYDVFLCHNSEDKQAIRKINTALQAKGINTWLDEDQILPGNLWQSELEKQIIKIRNACVFVGRNGMGPWQDIEIRAFLTEFLNRGCPIIPVILPNATQVPDLPIFLKQMMWVDLRKDYNKNFSRMILALKKK